MTTPIEDLREAARLLRERAGKATPGPWEDDGGEIHGAHVGIWVGETLQIRDLGLTNANSAYIAALHPGVGLALAVWLDWMVDAQEAAEVDDIHDRGYVVDGLNLALAVARAYLGRPS
jgi:hypothetical protein